MTTSLEDPQEQGMPPGTPITGSGQCEDGENAAFERAEDTRPAPAGADPRRRRSRGFTLVELLVVLVILGLLAVIAVPQVAKLLGGAERKTAAIQIDQLSSILDIYRLDVGRYPSNEDGLNALVERPAGVERWNGPYLRKAESLIDPWGNPYVYRYPGEHGEFDIYSLGSDGREGGEDNNADITSW